MNEIEIRAQTIQKYTLLCVEGALACDFGQTRPEAAEVFVLEWPDAGIVIPWPEGLTAKQAVY